MFGSNSTGWTALAIAAGVGVVSAYLWGQQFGPVIVASQQPIQPVDTPQRDPSLTAEEPLETGSPLENDVFEPAPALHGADPEALQSEAPVEEGVLIPHPGDPHEQGVSEVPARPIPLADDSEFAVLHESSDGDPAALRNSAQAMLDLARNPSVTQLAELGRAASDLTLDLRGAEGVVDAALQATEDALRHATTVGKAKFVL